MFDWSLLIWVIILMIIAYYGGFLLRCYLHKKGKTVKWIAKFKENYKDGKITGLSWLGERDLKKERRKDAKKR